MTKENDERVNKIEQTVNENGIFIRSGTPMNSGVLILEDVFQDGEFIRDGSSVNMDIFEDDFEDYEDEVIWIINHAKEQSDRIKVLESLLRKS